MATEDDIEKLVQAAVALAIKATNTEAGGSSAEAYATGALRLAEAAGRLQFPGKPT